MRLGVARRREEGEHVVLMAAAAAPVHGVTVVPRLFGRVVVVKPAEAGRADKWRHVHVDSRNRRRLFIGHTGEQVAGHVEADPSEFVQKVHGTPQRRTRVAAGNDDHVAFPLDDEAVQVHVGQFLVGHPRRLANGQDHFCIALDGVAGAGALKTGLDAVRLLKPRFQEFCRFHIGAHGKHVGNDDHRAGGTEAEGLLRLGHIGGDGGGWVDGASADRRRLGRVGRRGKGLGHASGDAQFVDQSLKPALARPGHPGAEGEVNAIVDEERQWLIHRVLVDLSAVKVKSQFAVALAVEDHRDVMPPAVEERIAQATAGGLYAVLFVGGDQSYQAAAVQLDVDAPPHVAEIPQDGHPRGRFARRSDPAFDSPALLARHQSRRAIDKEDAAVAFQGKRLAEFSGGVGDITPDAHGRPAGVGRRTVTVQVGEQNGRVIRRVGRILRRRGEGDAGREQHKNACKHSFPSGIEWLSICRGSCPHSADGRWRGRPLARSS